jgi:hypothetical protein
MKLIQAAYRHSFPTDVVQYVVAVQLLWTYSDRLPANDKAIYGFRSEMNTCP